MKFRPLADALDPTVDATFTDTGSGISFSGLAPVHSDEYLRNEVQYGLTGGVQYSITDAASAVSTRQQFSPGRSGATSGT